MSSLTVVLAACSQSQAPSEQAVQPQPESHVQVTPPTAAEPDKKAGQPTEQELRARVLEGDDNALQEYSERYWKKEFGKPSQATYMELLEAAAVTCPHS